MADDAVENVVELESEPLLIMKKTYKIFGVPVFTYQLTGGEEEFYKKMKDDVLKAVNDEIKNMLPAQPTRQPR